MAYDKESFNFLNSLIEEIPIGIIVVNKENIVDLINFQAVAILGLEGDITFYEEVNVLTFLSSTKLKNRIKKSQSGKLPIFRLRALPIKSQYINVIGKQINSGLVLNFTDVTAGITQRDQETQLLLRGQEMERRRLAKEIHDGIGPALSTIKLQINGVNNKLENPLLKETLASVGEDISDVANEIRSISHALMPSSLIDFGLSTVLHNAVRKVNDAGIIEVDLETNIGDGQLTKVLELNLYRIIQELLNNALKYSKCTTINIKLNKVDKEIELLLIDDGIGMDTELSSSGIGLHNIATRVKSFRGVFTVESTLGNGFKALVLIPLKRV